jgi:MoxR-like ATPase
LNSNDVRAFSTSLIDELSRYIVGKKRILEYIIAAMLSEGHVLIEDYPGLAKTLIARSISEALGCDFRRIQFTPDLLPSDITGSVVLNRKSNEFEFRQGPVFTNILLADEINRAPPKTQSALLEAMQERQVTVEGQTMHMQEPFIVIATQNPIEYQGTYPLPEAQLDRFMISTSVGYPTAAEEVEILRLRLARKKDSAEVTRVVERERFIALQKAIEEVYVTDELLSYISEIARSTRAHSFVEIGASPRGTLALLKLSMAIASMRGRDYVIPDDVKEIAIPALAHRLILKPEPYLRGVRSSDIIAEILKQIPVPKVA